ncbi:MAG: YvcK family protein [Candidatus Omnitrophica bacterium]|nr:YvcK family protein [Candidatus Omnitrophota bacterium]
MKVLKFLKWFYPGLKVKRWIVLLSSGVFLLAISIARFLLDTLLMLKILDTLLFILGLILFTLGIRYLIRSFFEVIGPNKELIDIIYEKRYLSRGPRVVTIGGGTGLSTILEGLKEHTSNITAIVAVADEGGSSGRLREEFGILPPGDIRNCLVSLAEAPQLMRDLFQYRFEEGKGIKGHSFGNLFITALTEVTGSFEEAIEESSKVLAIKGKVIPSSLDRVRLKAQYLDGSIKEGEDKIPKEGKPIKRVWIIPEYAKPNPQAIEAIREAEVIILGPGSLFTSILPNLLIEEITKAICSRKDILRLYICNVMTQHGETDGLTAYDHWEKLIMHTHPNIVNCCLVNCGRLPSHLLFRYSQEKSFPVIPDTYKLREKGILVFEKDVVSRENYLRHDPYKTAREIMGIYGYFKRKWKRLRKK